MSRSICLGLLGTLLLVACGDRKPEAAAVAAMADAAASAAVAQAVASAVAADGAASASAEASDAVVMPSGSADRLPPPKVDPIERDGVRYAQAADGREVGQDQVGGVLVASAADTGKQLWTLAVYGNPMDTKLEADVQWIFFRSMVFEADGRLRIVNEAGKAFLVDVHTRTVTPAP
jgi:hypothetical protein